MTNYDIAEFFTALARLMDLHGENSFKVKTYSIAAYNIEKLEAELAQMDDATLFAIKGIGETVGRKIREILTTGKLGALEELLAQTPPGVLEIMQVKGLGPKKVAVIWKEMGIETLGELEYACHENRLAAYKGFGAKTQDAILQSIAFMRQNQGFHLWAEVEQPGNDWIARLQRAFPAYRFALTGQIRRQSEILSSIEILSDMPAGVLPQYWQSASGVKIEESNGGRDILLKIQGSPDVAFSFVPKEDFWTEQFTRSCSAAFLEAFAAAYTLPQQPVSEEAIFTNNQLQFIVPALRETPAILQQAATNSIPRLVEKADIKGIIHAHSKWSDGQESIETMARTAKEQGFEYLVMSDHSQSAYYANGLNPERIAAQHIEIDQLNKTLGSFRIFKSIEADILNDGSLDYDNNVLSTFDLVIASVHSNLKMTEEKAMARLIKAIENPYTTILGHMTGRLLLSRAGYPVDHRKIIDACAANKVVIEINAHPRRLDIDWRWIGYALEKGVLLSIDPDAHALAGFHDVYYGCKAAQKGGLSPEFNLSSFGLQAFEAFVSSRKS